MRTECIGQRGGKLPTKRECSKITSVADQSINHISHQQPSTKPRILARWPELRIPYTRTPQMVWYSSCPKRGGNFPRVVGPASVASGRIAAPWRRQRLLWMHDIFDRRLWLRKEHRNVSGRHATLTSSVVCTTRGVRKLAEKLWIPEFLVLRFLAMNWASWLPVPAKAPCARLLGSKWHAPPLPPRSLLNTPLGSSADCAVFTLVHGKGGHTVVMHSRVLPVVWIWWLLESKRELRARHVGFCALPSWACWLFSVCSSITFPPVEDL